MRGVLSYLLLLLAAVSISVQAYHYQHGINKRNIKKRQAPRTCQEDDRFRRMDGWCNNLFRPHFGSAGSVMPRFRRNAYDDRANTPRANGQSGRPLPGPRTVSVLAHGPSDSLSKVTLMVMQWGQFLDHDVVITPHIGVSPDCCVNQVDSCFNIEIPGDDEFFTDRDCMPFVRSTRTEVRGIGEQSNDLTAFIDASNVYGSSDEERDELKDTGRGGRLRVTDNGSRPDFLPAGPDDSCRNETNEICFLAGDERVNEQPGLAAMHTIWVREHNRIAEELTRRFGWDSDRVFEEARRIVGAEMQAITYNEFLPKVLGPVFMENYELRSDQRFQYDGLRDPGIRNEFATAAYRFGHSLIPEDINVNGRPLSLRDLFMKPTVVLQEFKELTEALGTDLAHSMDRQFSHSVTRHLFEEDPRSGFDLVALNIQRGRDHGLQPFNEYRRMCFNRPFTELSQLFPDDATAQSVYEDIDDVDLFTGGVAERSVDDGLVGPTFACLLATQFSFLRDSDRFFYLNRQGPQAFTSEQIDEINEVRLSKVICDNTENEEIQPDVFLPEGDGNSKRRCADLPSINLRHWEDQGRRRPRRGDSGSSSDSQSSEGGSSEGPRRRFTNFRR